MKAMGFHEDRGTYEVENPWQFVALTEALRDEFLLEQAPTRRAKKGEAIRALTMSLSELKSSGGLCCSR